MVEVLIVFSSLHPSLLIVGREGLLEYFPCRIYFSVFLVEMKSGKCLRPRSKTSQEPMEMLLVRGNLKTQIDVLVLQDFTHGIGAGALKRFI